MTAGKRMIRGSAKILAAELLSVPAGLIIVTFLTRNLGPRQFGIYALSVGVVTWVEWTLNTFLSRPSVRLTGETENWKPVAGSILKFGLVISSVAAVAVFALSSIVALILKEPGIAEVVRLFAFDIPLMIFAQSHRAFAAGTESYSVRWRLAVLRWLLRPVLIVLLVSLYNSPRAAVAGWLTATFLEAVICGAWIPLPLRGSSSRATFPRLLYLAAPISLFGMILRLYEKLDVFLLKILGISTAAAGIYSAAQSISLAPGIMTMSLAPLLLGTTTRAIANGRGEEARSLSRGTLRALIAFFPFILVAGLLSERIIHLVFGTGFEGAAKVLPFLLISAYFNTLLSFSASILIALGRPTLSMWFALPMIPLSIAANWIAIPRFGPIGAAVVSACVAAVCAIPLLFTTYRAVQEKGRDLALSPEKLADTEFSTE